MTAYAILDANGMVIGVGEAQDEFEAGASGSEFGTVQLIPTGVTVAAETHYWDGSDFQTLPAKPEEWLEWDGSAWVEPRDSAQVEAQLHQARLIASLPTPMFLLGLAELGAYAVSEVSEYDFPPTLDEFLSDPGFTSTEHDYIKAGLKSWPTIERANTRIEGPIHPSDPGDGLPYFTDWLATEKSITITSEQLDTMFNVDVPPPLYTP